MDLPIRIDMKTTDTLSTRLAMCTAFVVISACTPTAQDTNTETTALAEEAQADSQLHARAVQEAHTAVVSLLNNAAGAWNRGDLDGFMSDYAPGSATTFVTSKGVLRGPEAIQQMYSPRFAAGVKQDSLSFENVEVDVLADDALHVLAYYKLMRGDSITSRGPTSLIMRWLDGRWQITHDHSS